MPKSKCAVRSGEDMDVATDEKANVVRFHRLAKFLAAKVPHILVGEAFSRMGRYG